MTQTRPGMHMTDDEICAMYRDAANKSKQIGILADLNCTDKDKIREILYDHEIMKKPGRPSTGPKPRKDTKKAKKEAENPEAEKQADNNTGQQASVRITERLSVPEGTPLTKVPAPPSCVIKAIHYRLKDISTHIQSHKNDIQIFTDAIRDLENERDDLMDYLRSQQIEYEE